MGVASIMEITEFDVSLGKLVTRTLTAQEEADILAINSMGVINFSYNIEDSYENKIASVKAQYMAIGKTEEEAEAFAINFVR